MRFILTLFLLTVAGCSSFLSTPEGLASEFLTSDAPGRPFRAITSDIHVDQIVLDAMRDRAAASGFTLLAVARLPRGIHPYSVLAWRQKGESVDLLETAMYWGRVDGKWTASSTPGELTSLASAARTEMKCSPGPAGGPLYGTAFVIWDDGDQITCENGLFADDASAFWDQIDAISDREIQTYDFFGQSPPDARLERTEIHDAPRTE